MSIEIGSGSELFASTGIHSSSARTNSLKDKLGNINNATDDELMEACKSFEAYMLEQVMKEMRKTVRFDQDEEKNPYLEQFEDILYEEYAKSAAEDKGIGIAQMLYEAMKRNS
jgi:flagellar protein FlgJ